MIIERNVTEYLRERGVNLSEFANKKFLELAVEMGYHNMKNDLRYHEGQVKKLRKHIDNKKRIDNHEGRFYLQFLGYLASGHKTMTQINAWLNAQTNNQYRDIIGTSGNLTDEKIAQLIASAHTYQKQNGDE